MAATYYSKPYSNILYYENHTFKDGFIETFTVGPPTAAANPLGGFLKQYQNTDARRSIVIDKVEIYLDPLDVSQNYLNFVLTKAELNLAENPWAMVIPTNEIPNGNPNYSNRPVIIKPGWWAQVQFVPTSTESTIQQYFQYRVRMVETEKALLSDGGHR
jgi:hypothetical protein